VKGCDLKRSNHIKNIKKVFKLCLAVRKEKDIRLLHTKGKSVLEKTDIRRSNRLSVTQPDFFFGFN
jgi:hypothetical protein